MRRLPVLVLALGSILGTAVVVAPAASGTSMASWCVESPTLEAASLPRVFSVADCSMEGRVIRDHGVGAQVPAAGSGVFAEGYGLNTQVLTIKHNADGVIRLGSVGSETSADVRDRADVPLSHEFDNGGPECFDDAHEEADYSESDDHKWFLNRGTYPSYLSKSEVTTAMARGTNNIENARNGCAPLAVFGNKKLSNIDHTLAGYTSLRPNISSAPDCLDDDDVNTVGFGRMNQFLAVNCSWYYLLTWESYETDVMFNTNETWTTNPDELGCVLKYDVEAVMTHERGHTFGVGHVSELEHSRMTMSTNIDGPCQAQERWLGEGDFIALTFN